MTDKIIGATIEILGKYYQIRCPESQQQALHEAAAFLNDKMKEVQDTGKVIDPQRIAVITALNISYLYLQQDQQKSSFMGKINQKISQLQDKLDHAINKSMQAELIYTDE
jgi:cell division protein ZapA